MVWRDLPIVPWTVNTVVLGLGFISAIEGYRTNSVVVTVCGTSATIGSFISFLLARFSSSRIQASELDDRLGDIEAQLTHAQNQVAAMQRNLVKPVENSRPDPEDNKKLKLRQFHSRSPSPLSFLRRRSYRPDPEDNKKLKLRRSPSRSPSMSSLPPLRRPYRRDLEERRSRSRSPSRPSFIHRPYRPHSEDDKRFRRSNTRSPSPLPFHRRPYRPDPEDDKKSRRLNPRSPPTSPFPFFRRPYRRDQKRK